MISKAFWFVSNTTKSIACVQTSPLPHKKLGEETLLFSLLPIFSEGGGTSVHRLPSRAFSLVFTQTGKATMHTYVAPFPISPLRDLKHLGTLLRTNLILVLQWRRYTGWAILQCQNAPGVPMKHWNNHVVSSEFVRIHDKFPYFKILSWFSQSVSVSIETISRFWGVIYILRFRHVPRVDTITEVSVKGFVWLLHYTHGFKHFPCIKYVCSPEYFN